MPEMPKAHITHDIAIHNHLWAWLRSPEERRDNYQLLKLAGYGWPMCQRCRDWSEPKIKRLLQDKEPKQLTLTIG